MESINKRYKVVFLDFDGVLHAVMASKTLNDNKIKLIANLLDITHAKVVVSSSWAVGCKDAKDFVNRNFNYDIKSEPLKFIIDSIIDVTDQRKDTPRGEQIQEWLDAHEDYIISYVIIDDDADMLDEQLFNFVQTDSYEGITEREANLAALILNKKHVPNPIRLNDELKEKYILQKNGVDTNISNLLSHYY